MIKIDRFTLRNGLTIISHQREHATQAIVCVTYRAGSVDDYPGKEGLANLVRWTVHSSSLNIPDHVLHNANAGAQVDSKTTHDVSQFFITLPQENLESAFWLQSDRMIGSEAEEESIPRLKKWLHYKIDEELSSEYRYIMNVVKLEAYETHPYRTRVLGTKQSVDHIEFSDIGSFYKYYYTPSNACLTVSSGLSSDRVFELAEKWFGGIPPSTVERAPRQLEPVRTKPKVKTLDKWGPENYIYRAYPIKGRQTDEYFYADCLSDMQMSQLLGPLREVVGDDKIFSSIEAWVIGTFESDLLVFAASVRLGDYMEAAIYELDQALSKLAKYSPEEWEVKGLLNRRIYDFGFDGSFSGEKFVSTLSISEMAGGADYYNESVEKVRALDLKAMSWAWRSILNPERTVTIISRNNKK